MIDRKLPWDDEPRNGPADADESPPAPRKRKRKRAAVTTAAAVAEDELARLSREVRYSPHSAAAVLAACRRTRPDLIAGAWTAGVFLCRMEHDISEILKEVDLPLPLRRLMVDALAAVYKAIGSGSTIPDAWWRR